MIKKIKLKKLKKRLKQVPKSLADHVFGFFMLLVFIFLILGGIIFYQYSFLTEKMQPVALPATVQYKENAFNEILDQWSKREERFQEAETKQYPDLFNLTQ